MADRSARDTTLDEALIAEADALANRISDQLDQAERLRTLADRVDQHTADLRALLEDMEAALGTAAQLRISDLDGRLRGQRLEEVAIAILRNRAEPHAEIHYRQWLALLQDEGHRVAGKDPAATFLAQITRSPRVERVGNRTGLYRLSDAA